jgi:toxin-antitoxin system PIN domain toxin
VNVLIALLDSDHVDHERAIIWLDGQIGSGWASCAITENGFVRILSQPRYPSPVSTATAAELLRHAQAESDHAYWPCEISLLDQTVINHSRLHGARQVTDAYLLALAVAHGGRFATFDRSVSLDAVRDATEDHVTVL